MHKKVLVVSPHPDDEVLGCGGIISKFKKDGIDVYVLIVTRGSPNYYSDEVIQNIRDEARRAHSILGVKHTEFLDFYAPELDITSQASISRAICNFIIQYQITTLFLPHRGDIHHDHRVVFQASLVAARPFGNYTVQEIFCYETLSETEWAPPFGDDAFIPNHFVNIEEDIDAKIEALSCFISQIRPFPSSRSLEAIEALAKIRGSTVGFRYAEAFMTIRTINK